VYLPPDARAALEHSTKVLIAERDAHYGCVSDSEGRIYDEQDRHELARLKAAIERNQAVLDTHRDDPVRELLDEAKQLQSTQFLQSNISPGRWYRLQAAITKVDALYTEAEDDSA
jgi:hypothetical protein